MIMRRRALHARGGPLRALAQRDRGDQRLRARARLPRRRQEAAEAARPLSVAETGRHQGLRRHRAGDGEAAGPQAAGLGWQGKHTNLVSRELGNWFFLGAIFTDLELPRMRRAPTIAARAGRLPRHLPDAGVPGALPARCAALHQLSDDRARRAGRSGAAGRCSATASTAATTAWRFARGTSSPRRRATQRSGRGRAREPAARGSRGARRRRLPHALQRIADQAHRPRDRFVRNVLYAIGNPASRARRPAAHGSPPIPTWRCATRRNG